MLLALDKQQINEFDAELQLKMSFTKNHTSELCYRNFRTWQIQKLIDGIHPMPSP